MQDPNRLNEFEGSISNVPLKPSGLGIRKLPRELECPVDNVFLDVAERSMPYLRKTGHTPNQITTYAMICTLASLWSLIKGKFPLFALFFNAGYLFDCMDGYYARVYKMSSKFGDLYEHFRDIGGGLATFAMVYSLYRPIPKWLYPVFGGFVLGSMQHIGCQQKYVSEMRLEASRAIDGKDNEYGNDSQKDAQKDAQKESIDKLQCLCPSNVPAKKSLQVTRWLGSGTLTLASTVLVGVLHWRKHRRLF